MICCVASTFASSRLVRTASRLAPSSRNRPDICGWFARRQRSITARAWAIASARMAVASGAVLAPPTQLPAPFAWVFPSATPSLCPFEPNGSSAVATGSTFPAGTLVAGSGALGGSSSAATSIPSGTMSSPMAALSALTSSASTVRIAEPRDIKAGRNPHRL